MLRKRAEKKCTELRQKLASLESEYTAANSVLTDSARIIQEQMVTRAFPTRLLLMHISGSNPSQETLNGLKDELVRLRRFKSKILAQDGVFGSPTTTSRRDTTSSLTSDVSLNLPMSAGSGTATEQDYDSPLTQPHVVKPQPRPSSEGGPVRVRASFRLRNLPPSIYASVSL